MKTWLASILFVIIFAGSWIPKVGMEQSFKANELLKHFQDHKRQAPAGFSFMDFLWMHYAADSKHAKTTSHPSLPSFDFSGVSGYVLPSIYLVFILPLLFVLPRRQLINWQNLYRFSLARVLIAPPRY
ncbi:MULTISPECIES: hypothetical protein [Aquirufa]|uniref:Uncharacterized protein n=2 Tax=Aquirufa TaxID=2676247 RepID=A0ABT4JFU9_9BACT|nr:hypothetical protein [Aquirufa ecclesiirivi]MCZ2473373.1 hypothetical protein [Aquirufa ecclesiirivi]MCZ2475156.1 hypothetical protein [Aquirufa ecclesiirivi]MDF0692427.1 hypothetical protein [Aquirufa ecclesiirivi]NHC48190.1 hypothetical protein [Aquirufa ecclesiirivi]